MIPSRTRAGLLGAAAALAAVAVTATPAAAHPFGPPSTARTAAHGSELTLTWLAAEDDWVALGQSLGAFADPSTEITGEEKLRRSPAVRDYLLERMSVRQGGQPCHGRLAELANLLRDGARLTFECPATVGEVEIRLSALTDLNEAYRTVLVAETPADPGQVLFTSAQPSHRVRFTASGTTGGGAAAVAPLAIGTGAVVAGGAGLAFVLRRRRRVAAVAR